MLDNMTEFFVAVDQSDEIVFVNQALTRIIAPQGRDFIGQSLWELWPEMKGSLVEDSFARASTTGLPVRFEYHYPRTGVWIDVNVYPSGGFRYAYFRDITAQKHEEEERNRRDAELRSMVDSIPQIAWASDPEHGPRYLNRRWFEYTGLDPAEPYDLTKVVPPEDIVAINVKSAATPGEPFEHEIRLRRHDGVYRWHLVRVAPYRSPEGTLLGYFGTSTDIDEIRGAEEILHATTDAVPALITYLDAGGVYRFCNRAYEAWFERPREEIVGRHLRDVVGQETFEKMWPELQRALAGETVKFEQWLVYVAKGRRFMRGSYIPRFGRDGQVEGLFALVADDTEARLTQEARQASEDRFRAIFASVNVGLAEVDPEANVFLEVNQGLCEMLGYSREELIGRSPYDLTHLDDRTIGVEQVEEVRRGLRASASWERRYLRKDGATVWLLVRATRVRTGTHGQPTNLGVYVDITKRKVAEEALRRTQESLTLAMKGGRMGWWTRDFITEEVTWSPELEELFGLERGSFHGTRNEFLHYVHVEDREEFTKVVTQAIRTGEDYAVEFRFRRADGSEGWMEGRGRAVYDREGRPTMVYGVGIDVTVRKATEKALRFLVDLEEVTRSLDDASQIMAVTARMLGEHLGVDRCAYAEVEEDEDHFTIQGDYTRGDAISIVGRYAMAAFGRRALAEHREGKIFVVNDVDRDVPDPEEQEVYRLTQIQAVISVPLMKRGRFVAGMAVHQRTPRRWTPGEIEQVQMVVDRCWAAIERVRAERAMARNEQRLRRILEASTVGVVVNDEAGRFLYANPPLLRMLGYTQAELVRGELTWSRVQAPEHLERDDEALEQLQTTSVCEPYETELVRSDGTRLSVYIGAALVPDDSGSGQLGAAFITDLTTVKEAERNLRALNAELDARVQARTADLEAANEQLQGFTYHVSHDLRAPLRAIVSTSRMLQEDFGEEIPRDALQMLARQAEAANKLGQLIDDLLKLSRLSHQEIVRRPLDVTELARDATAEALSSHAGTLVRVEVQEGLEAEADERLLKLALANLIENAVKYSPAGGTVRVGQRPDGAYFVADEGIGIDMAYANKIFEPFQRLHRDDQFTGTGIGLSNVRQVIERHGGRVWVESEPGRGSTFLFTLPRSLSSLPVSS